MRVLYIGQYTKGTTSRMRGQTIKTILNPENFQVIDTHIPFYKTNSILRSVGFRYKKGPLIKNTNGFILNSIKQELYDLIWIDKAVFITSKTTKFLKSRAKKLVHFTPDPAFTFHQSKLFFKSLPYYDYVITTKSYELDAYKKHVRSTKVIYATQGFDKTLHCPADFPFSQKRGFVFLGHYEKERALVIKLLLSNAIEVTLAGIEWEEFAKENKDNKNLKYLGKGVYGEDYVQTLQKAKIAWGAISKWVPELHTTRTFEIPACGTALLTERNKETNIFFKEDEALFYDNDEELLNQVLKYMQDDEALKMITEKGRQRVLQDGYDYSSILQKLLNSILA